MSKKNIVLLLRNSITSLYMVGSTADTEVNSDTQREGGAMVWMQVNIPVFNEIYEIGRL